MVHRSAMSCQSLAPPDVLCCCLLSALSAAFGSCASQLTDKVLYCGVLHCADYAEMLNQVLMAREAPRPRICPVPPNHADYDKFVDIQRVSYLRLKQQRAIVGSFMTGEEKERVLAQKLDVLKDKVFLDTIASRTGMYIQEEVRLEEGGLHVMKEVAKRVHTTGAAFSCLSCCWWWWGSPLFPVT